MLSHPRLKAGFESRVLGNRVLFLLSEHAQHVFEGPVYAALAPLLDGTHAYGEILAQAGKRVPWPLVTAALAQLERRGCLMDGAALDEPRAAAFWDGLSVAPERVASGLGDAVTVTAPDGVPADRLARAFEHAGLQVAEADGLPVVAIHDYLDPALAAINAEALRSGRPWLLLKPTGTVVWIGPLFRPGETGCWECLAQRLRVNRQVEHYVRTRSGETAVMPQSGWLESSVAAAASLAAIELARALTEERGDALAGRVRTLDLLGRELGEHVLVRQPWCRACGQPPATDRLPAAPTLHAAARPVGEERSTSPGEVLERYEHHLSPITGAVLSLTPRERPGRSPAHNYVAGHYFPVTSDDLSALRVNLLARSGGKGRSEVQARTSALCEALERYSGIAWGDEPRRQASCRELGDDAIHVRELALFSEAQYAQRERTNAEGASEYHDVPPPLDEDAAVSWTPLWSLTRERVRWVPTAYCYYGFRDPGLFFTRCDSNGNAAGASLEEALLYGLLELVERDAVALWWYSRVRRPALDAASFGLPRWAEMVRHYQRQGRDLRALDLTSDLGIPVVGVVSRREGHPVEDIIVGFAAHLDPAVALARALEEANQYLPSVSERGPDGATRYRLFNAETVQWWRTATYENQPWLLPHPEAASRGAGDLAALGTGDLAGDVRACVKAVEGAGLEVMFLDQTRPDIGLPVVKVVVPGLRHFWRRLAPGRLYDVPVKLGWLERPLAEDELNPIACFV